jgi:hypothetical protein
MRRIAVSTLTVLSLALPSTASAHKLRHRGYVAGNPITAAVNRAEQYWNTKPCGGRPTITTGEVTPELLQMWTEEWGHPITTAGAWTNRAACTITLNIEWFPSWQADDESFTNLCATMVHEFGNLLGVPERDVEDGNIMDIEGMPTVPVPCERYRLITPRGQVAENGVFYPRSA